MFEQLQLTGQSSKHINPGLVMSVTGELYSSGKDVDIRLTFSFWVVDVTTI